jgi:YesN/AraC family two-component response regulator
MIRILIVDDEECLRSMLITILEDENFLNIITADCVKTALEICQQRKPDIAICYLHKESVDFL